ncbi:MAG: hypothetical protein ACLP7P_15525 [Rhodomicrobium sp.]
MSSGPDRDMIDYVEDTSQREDETLFLPVPEPGPDRWSAFYIGILVGIAGGGLVPLAPWLAGILVLTGYGLTAFTLRASTSRFARALFLGFVLSASVGAILIAGEIFVPQTAWNLIAALSERPLIFPGIAAMPWVIGILRYAYALVRHEKRIPRAGVRRRLESETNSLGGD